MSTVQHKTHIGREDIEWYDGTRTFERLSPTGELMNMTKVGDVINVKDSPFSASVDASDNSTAINKAISAIDSGTILIPEIYPIKSAINGKANVDIVGIGTGSGFRLDANIWGITYTGINYSGIRNLIIEAGTSCLGGILIQNNSHHNMLENILIKGDVDDDHSAVMVDGIKIDTSYWTELNHCDANYQTGKSLWLVNANQTTTIGGYYGIAAYSLYLNASTTCSFMGTDFCKGTTTGVYLTGSLRGSKLNGCRIERGTSGTGTGLHIDGATGFLMDGGGIVEYTTNTVNFDGNAHECILRGVYIDNSESNIVFHANSRQNQLEHCYITDPSGITWGGMFNEFHNCRYGTEGSARAFNSRGQSTQYIAGSGSFSLDNFHETIKVGNLTDDLTITLPDASKVPRGKKYTIKLGTVGAYTVTIARTNSQTIDGADSDITLDTINESVTLQMYNDDRWIIVAAYLYP